jgi:threonine/homoserine/homoserine lactone efflux protein
MIVLDTTTLITYCIAAIALVIAPGPGQALVLISVCAWTDGGLAGVCSPRRFTRLCPSK